MKDAPPVPSDGRHRVAIENVTPVIDGGRYPIKRVVGETVCVEADLFADGHDVLSAVVKFRSDARTEWTEIPMHLSGNDRWRAEFTVAELGGARFTIVAWVDPFESWRRDVRKKLQAHQEVLVDLLAGAALVAEAARRATLADAETLLEYERQLRAGTSDGAADETLAVLMATYSERRFATQADTEGRVTVDPPLARFGAWYELFPRSCAKEPGRHGTFRDCEGQLDRIAGMGFDVLYLPPIHPIGTSFRKGKNNQTRCEPGDPGSPWGIGSHEGGHKSVHPELGTLEDFRRLVGRARARGIEVALDIALQCSPNHPYVAEHPEWFRKRPDGSIQYAENPPKKYQDIYPFDFECEAWASLWQELKSIFDFWIEQGVKVFRVDNPHTKPFAFWEWCLGELKCRDPDLIFLSEAFTRPKVMYRLAKLGFTQSYNYFPWRNAKDELMEYFTELSGPPVVEFFRSNLWTNTPDILTQYLQSGGRAAFMVRLILAATLGASYGIYGPAFELCEPAPREPGSEEYLHSEKYELRHWDLSAPQSLEELIARVNRIRREHRPLQSNHGLTFHPVSNDQLLAFTKTTEDRSETVLTVVNLDPHHTHHGWLELPLADFRLETRPSYQMQDLLTGARFLWKGACNYVELNPAFSPAHIFRLRQHARSERDFDYFT